MGWEELTDGVIVAGQPDGAPSWFPCNDHPSDKASFSIAVTADAGYHVVANGTLTERVVMSSRERWCFEQPEPMVWDEGGTYVQTDVVFTANVTHEWNHGLGEIITALFEAGMDLTLLEEHQSVPWDAIPGQMTDIGGGEMQLKDRPERLPHSYTLQAKRVR